MCVCSSVSLGRGRGGVRTRSCAYGSRSLWVSSLSSLCLPCWGEGSVSLGDRHAHILGCVCVRLYFCPRCLCVRVSSRCPPVSRLSLCSCVPGCECVCEHGVCLSRSPLRQCLYLSVCVCVFTCVSLSLGLSGCLYASASGCDPPKSMCERLNAWTGRPSRATSLLVLHVSWPGAPRFPSSFLPLRALSGS